MFPRRYAFLFKSFFRLEVEFVNYVGLVTKKHLHQEATDEPIKEKLEFKALQTTVQKSSPLQTAAIREEPVKIVILLNDQWKY